MYYDNNTNNANRIQDELGMHTSKGLSPIIRPNKSWSRTHWQLYDLIRDTSRHVKQSHRTSSCGAQYLCTFICMFYLCFHQVFSKDSEFCVDYDCHPGYLINYPFQIYLSMMWQFFIDLLYVSVDLCFPIFIKIRVHDIIYSFNEFQLTFSYSIFKMNLQSRSVCFRTRKHTTQWITQTRSKRESLQEPSFRPLQRTRQRISWCTNFLYGCVPTTFNEFPFGIFNSYSSLRLEYWLGYGRPTNNLI